MRWSEAQQSPGSRTTAAGFVCPREARGIEQTLSHEPGAQPAIHKIVFAVLVIYLCETVRVIQGVRGRTRRMAPIARRHFFRVTHFLAGLKEAKAEHSGQTQVQMAAETVVITVQTTPFWIWRMLRAISAVIS